MLLPKLVETKEVTHSSISNIQHVSIPMGSAAHLREQKRLKDAAAREPFGNLIFSDAHSQVIFKWLA